MKLDDSAQVVRVFNRQAIADFVDLSGFSGREPGTVPEPLIAGLFSYLLGAELPGFGTNYMKQELRFHAPAAVNEPLTAKVTITRLRPDKALVDLATRCTDASDRLICDGRALVLVTDVGRATTVNPADNGELQRTTTRQEEVEHHEE